MNYLTTATLATIAALGATLHSSSSQPLCTLVPGATMALIRVEKDTTLPFRTERVAMSSASSSRGNDDDLAVDGTPMPAGRVRLLEVDSATRAELRAGGITASRPVVFVRAAPYREDCRTVRWRSSDPFVKKGELGYVRGTLASRERWVNGVPVIVIPDAWYYPYPRRRGLLREEITDPLASAEAMYSLNAALEGTFGHPWENEHRARALAWARANPIQAEREPARSIIREALLMPDFQIARRLPSRVRGTYRVKMEREGHSATWYFRTSERLNNGWRRDPPATIASIIASPHISGYVLSAFVGPTPDSIPTEYAQDSRNFKMAWLKTTDRPTAPGNDQRRELPGILEFTMWNAPEPMWDVLEKFVPWTARDSIMWSRMQLARGRKQPRIPLTLRIDETGGVSGDTSLVVAGDFIRVRLERIDTLANKR